ncbi:hypothetical protein Glove_277g3 [Diversispora epigaea]|uniref:Uncharacterized protein n=1 Tax=Diversispora epigaea TaxID=1348612 RepID=A0A397I4G2_9GLOM|nr:hypothetical protein Glove_277g3 [Diversispora epigaea]
MHTIFHTHYFDTHVLYVQKKNTTHPSHTTTFIQHTYTTTFIQHTYTTTHYNTHTHLIQNFLGSSATRINLENNSNNNRDNNSNYSRDNRSNKDNNSNSDNNR